MCEHITYGSPYMLTYLYISIAITVIICSQDWLERVGVCRARSTSSRARGATAAASAWPRWARVDAPPSTCSASPAPRCAAPQILPRAHATHADSAPPCMRERSAHPATSSFKHRLRASFSRQVIPNRTLQSFSFGRPGPVATNFESLASPPS